MTGYRSILREKKGKQKKNMLTILYFDFLNLSHLSPCHLTLRDYLMTRVIREDDEQLLCYAGFVLCRPITIVNPF